MKAPTGFGGPGCVPGAVGTTGAQDSSESHAAGTPNGAASASGMLTTTVAARSGLVPPVAKAPQRAASAKCMLTTTFLGRAYVAAPTAKGQPSVASARGELPTADAACAGYIPPTAKGCQRHAHVDRPRAGRCAATHGEGAAVCGGSHGRGRVELHSDLPVQGGGRVVGSRAADVHGGPAAEGAGRPDPRDPQSRKPAEVIIPDARIAHTLHTVNQCQPRTPVPA